MSDIYTSIHTLCKGGRKHDTERVEMMGARIPRSGRKGSQSPMLSTVPCGPRLKLLPFQPTTATKRKKDEGRPDQTRLTEENRG